MFSKIITLIILWSLGFALWVFAGPSSAPGTGSGLISAMNNYVGIGIAIPQYKLDVVGTIVGTDTARQSIYSRATDGGMTRFGLKNAVDGNWSISNYGTSYSPNNAFVIADETASAVRFLITKDGYVAIGNTQPAGMLDIDGHNKSPSGAVIIRNGILNMTGNNINMNNGKIIGLAAPTDPQDAATKDYVDKNPSKNNNSSSSKVWGEGRPGVILVAETNGECKVNNNSIKISRSTELTSWNGSAAACPKNWWVCKASERGNNLCSVQFPNQTVISCIFDINGNNFASASSQKVWVSDGTGGAFPAKGSFISATGGATDYEPKCSLLPVWCCADAN